MKNQLFFILITVSLSIPAFSQLNEDFSDGDFSENPTWEGAIDKFIINNGVLQLSDDTPGSSNTASLALFAPTSLDTTTVWSFKVNMDFSPSTSNFSRIYLAANSSNFSSLEAAYYIQVGGISGTNDAIELYRQDEGADKQLLIQGTPGAVGTSPVLATIRVTRTSAGLWTLESDYTGGTNFVSEGSTIDNTYNILNYFGIYCQYSSSRSDKFFFDDIYINALYADQMAPELLSINPLNSDSILLVFNEPIAQSSIAALNFSINNGIGNPKSAILKPQQSNEIILVLENPLQNLTTYELTVKELSDINGNIAEPINSTFDFLFSERPELGDVLLSEFMANPRNAVGLPNIEYIELFNNSNKVLNLEGMGIASGGSPKILPEVLMLPGEYLILANNNDILDLAAFGRTIGISSLASLSNTSDEISLSLADGTISQHLNYTLSWYEDEGKQDGGYSLERIDFSQPENCPGNWSASEDAKGGSPGIQNSILGSPTEQEPPNLLAAFPQSENVIELVFDETLGELMTMNSIYNLTPGIGISTATITGINQNQIELGLAIPIQEGVLYNLIVTQTEDCLGNFGESPQTIDLAIPQAIDEGDLLLNELLFNPQSGGKDYVEIVNTSDKVLNLKGITLTNQQKNTGNFSTEIEADRLILPNQIIAITPDVNDLKSRYPIPSTAIFLEAPLPTLDADEGNITIALNNINLDAFDYSEKQHNPLLENKRGVSLERLSLLVNGQATDNWASAAQTVGFGTPGYSNSQSFTLVNTTSDLFNLSNNTFSPDNDGFEDQLVLTYQVDRIGFIANIKVFDANGRPTKTLTRNESLAAEGIITWDGSTDEGSKARIGIYVVLIELFTPDGSKEVEKLTCVLAGRF